MKKIVAKKLSLIIGSTMIILLVLNLLIQREDALRHLKNNGVLAIYQIDNVLKREKAEYINKIGVDELLSQMPVASGMAYYVVDKNTMKVMGATDNTLVDMPIRARIDMWELGEIIKSGKNMETEYFYFEETGDYYIGISQTESAVFETVRNNMGQLFIYLFVAACVMIGMSMWIIDRYVIRGVDEIAAGVKEITGGKLETRIAVEQTPEFKILSYNINQMTESLLGQTVKISKVLDTVDMILAVYEYGSGSDKVLASGKIGPVLMLSEEETKNLLENKEIFEQKIDSIKQYSVEGFKKVYRLPVETECYLQIETYRGQQTEFGVILDVTEQIIEKQRLQKERDYDLLTGLLTRRAFYQKMKDLYLKPNVIKHAVMMMCDLDGLKQFNDTYGHANGDKAIKKAAEILTCISDKECYVSRLSGDEFAVFIYGADNDSDLEAKIQEIYEHMIAAEIEVYGKQINVRLSGGYVFYSKCPQNYDQLLKKADQALYESKENGRARFTEYKNC